MGWTWYNAGYYKNGKIDRKAEMDEKFNWTEGERKVSVLKSVMRGSVYYAAVRSQNESNGTDKTVAVVCLTSTNMKDYTNFGYKDMDETMGPGPSNCPKSILDLLTPTDSEWANEWRDRCRKNLERNRAKKPLPVGTIIEIEWNGEKRRLERMAPNHQFRRPWWLVLGMSRYIPARYLPKEYTIVTE